MPNSRITNLRLCMLCLAGVILAACQDEPLPRDTSPGSQGNSAPTQATRDANSKVASKLALSDTRDFEDASRGLIARPEQLRIHMADDTLIWDMPAYDFIDGDAPASVNPSLWRQAKLNNLHGLFEVTEGIYQLRGFDLSNMTIIEGANGWIVVDPLTTRETAAAAMDFARTTLGDHAISAIIFTHSHIDHFGGVQALLDPNRTIPIYAPEGFMAEATSENVIAGVTMGRRAMYMYGSQLERSPRGHVGSGLGKSPAMGSPGIAEPTHIIDETGQTLEIDGVTFVFQNAPGSEAPAELTFYLPEKKAFCGAELVSRNMHNLYTLRGAKVRDALRWSGYIDETLSLFADAEIYFGSHHWPLWGREAIVDFLKKQRDMYKYIHDQTLRLAAQGMTPGEIAETIELPEAIRQSFPNRGYYGTVKHNAKAVYQRYFGWYDGNPANLDPLPPEPAARRYVDMMGGAETVLRRAQTYFDEGDYRWVAEILNHVVFADPGNRAARELLAQTYDQLGYQAESGPWRDVYLTGALELRQGAPEQGTNLANAIDLLRATPLEEFFKAMATGINGPEADGERLTFNFNFTDLQQNYVLTLENAVLRPRLTGEPLDSADATIRLTHAMFLKLILGQVGIRDIAFSDDIAIEGSQLDLIKLFSLLDQSDEVFNVVLP